MIVAYVLGALMMVAGVGLAGAQVVDTPVAIGTLTIPGALLIVLAESYRRGVIGVDEPGRTDAPVRAGTDAPIRLPDELAHLPLTSAAEFRAAARPMQRAVLTDHGGYLVRVGFRGSAAFITGLLALTCFGELVTGTGSTQETLVLLAGGVSLGVLTALLVVSKHRSNRKRKQQINLNGLLRDLSVRVDEEVEAGRIPLTPPGWQGPVPPSLS